MDCQSSWRNINITINGVVRATPLLTTTKPRKIHKDGIYFGSVADCKLLSNLSANIFALLTKLLE